MIICSPNNLTMEKTSFVPLDCVQTIDGQNNDGQNNDGQNSIKRQIKQLIEIKTERFLMLDIMGEEYKILTRVAKQIPLLETLLETQPKNEPIILDEVSPKFFRLLDDFLKNGELVSIFKTNICIFKREMVDYWLKYLEMDKLHRTLLGCKYVGKRLVIDDVITLSDHYGCGASSNAYKLCDGSYMHSVPSDTLVYVSAERCSKRDNSGYVIQTKDGTKNVFLHLQHIIENNNMIFVELAAAKRSSLI